MKHLREARAERAVEHPSTRSARSGAPAGAVLQKPRDRVRSDGCSPIAERSAAAREGSLPAWAETA